MVVVGFVEVLRNELDETWIVFIDWEVDVIIRCFLG